MAKKLTTGVVEAQPAVLPQPIVNPTGFDARGNPFAIPNIQVQPSVTAQQIVNPPQQVQVPTPKVPTQPQQFVQRLEPTINQGSQGLITAQTREAEARNDVLSRLLNSDSASSQSIYDNAFRRQGGNEYLQQFTDANTRLAQLQGKFRTAKQAVSGAQGQSQAFEGVQLSEVGRQEAIDVGNQAILVQALQGNVETARQIALDTTRFATEDRQFELENLMAQFDALDGIVQGQEKQLVDNARIEAEREYDQLKRMQTAIDTAIQTGGASVEEMQSLSDTNISTEEKFNLANAIINRTVADQRTYERDFAKKQFDEGVRQFDANYKKKDYGVIGDDGLGNNVYGFIDPVSGTVKAVDTDTLNSKFVDGAIGGQCGEFAKSLTTLPTPNGRTGNEWSEKKAFVDQYGLSATEVRAGDVQPGDVLYFNLGTRYGHVATVIGNNGDGTVTVKDSNWNNDEKIQTRVVSLGDQRIYGSIRGTLKQGLSQDAPGSSTDLTNAMRSIAPRLSADGRKSATATLNQYIASGDAEGAKQFIMSTAISALPAEQQNKAFGRLQAIDSLNSIKGLLQQYQSKGGRTDVLTGTQEQIAQKLGNTSNAELAGIGNQIALAMAAYRNAVSGAAFTESEAKFYENIFPSTKNVGTLNNAKIDSLLSSFNLNQKTTLQTVLGAKNYDAIMSNGSSSGITTQSSSPEQDYINSILGGVGNNTQIPQPATQPTQQSFAKKATNLLIKTNPLLAPVATTYSYIKKLFGK